MTEEQAAELRYEAGMYQSLYEVAAARIEALEAELSTAQQVIYDLTEGITGTIQCDRIEALEAALRIITFMKPANDLLGQILDIKHIAFAALAPEPEK